MSSLPQNKQGVASAVNDAAREIGGALGIAVLGSALAGRYRHGLTSTTGHLPPAVADHAKAALAAALAIAKHLGPRGADLAAHAQTALVDGLGLAMLIAAASVAGVAAFVFWRAPRKTR